MTSFNNNWFSKSEYFDIRKKTTDELFRICKSYNLNDIYNKNKEEIIQYILKNVPVYIDGTLEYKKYSRELIHSIVEYTQPFNIKLLFTKNSKTSNIEIKFINEKAIITIVPYISWQDIKKQIDRILSIHTISECSICLNTKSINIDFNRCDKCYNIWCINCNIEFIKLGKGIIKCPFCRNESGTFLSEHILNHMIEMMTLDLYMKMLHT